MWHALSIDKVLSLLHTNLNGLPEEEVRRRRSKYGLNKIELKKSPWIKSFNGRSLQNPPLEQWAVKKDHGIFDQFTGATITPRAVVKAVKNALIFVNQMGDRLYD